MVEWKLPLPASLPASPGGRRTSPCPFSFLPSHLVIHPKAFRCTMGRVMMGTGVGCGEKHQTWLPGTAEPGFVTPVGSSGGSRPSPCFTDANSPTSDSQSKAVSQPPLHSAVKWGCLQQEQVPGCHGAARKLCWDHLAGSLNTDYDCSP